MTGKGVEYSSGTGDGLAPASDPLKSLREQLSWEKERYKPFPITQYIKGVLTGQYPHSARNAAELLVNALTVVPPQRHPAGYTDYPVFSAREDELAVKGIPRPIEALMRFIGTEAKLRTNDRGLVIVAPTGAGKSTIVNALIRSLEDYTERTTPAPVYGIKGCPINEEPLHVIDEKTRADWKDKYGLEITGHLCPSCRLKAEVDISKNTIGFKADAQLPLTFEVQAIPFSLALGRAITRLEPSTTKFFAPNATMLIPQIILGSSRGVLHIPELGQHVPAFLRSLNDLIRGRRYSVNKEIFELDNFIIADVTLPEWAEIVRDPENRSLIERFEVVFATYPLDATAERAIIEKRIFASQLTQPPHFSPQTLELTSEWAVRTRYRQKNNDASISEATKVRLYSGQDVNGFTQSDRKVIEADGRESGEGVVGISPPALWNIISKLVGEQLVQDSEQAENGCIDFVEVKKRVADYVDQIGIMTDPERKQMKEQLDSVASEFDRWLLQTIEQAFQDRYPERANKLLEDYLNESELVLNNQKTLDPQTQEEIDPNLEFVKTFEETVSPDLAKDQVGGERRKFRIKMAELAGKIKQKQGRDPWYSDFFTYFSHFEQGLKDLLAKDLGDVKDILKTRTPTEKQAQKLTEMRQRLVDEYAFCPCCAPKLAEYAANKLRQANQTK